MTPGLFLRRLDYVLIGAVAALCAIGWLTIETATRGDIPGDPDYFTVRHSVYLGLGVAAGLVLMLLDPKLLRRVTWPIYGVTLALLVVVLVISSSSARGSSRWIPLPFFQLQPSELGKLALTVCLAAFVAERLRDGAGSWRLFGSALALIAPAILLVYVEPDLGTSIVYGAVTLTILFVAGARLTQLGLLAVLGVVGALLVFNVLPAAGVHVVKEYQVARLTAFLHPSDDPQSLGWQVQQSKIAIGSGGLAGKGAGGATQTRKGFLPEHHTDFVFAVIGEQRGFLGVAVVLLLFLLVVWRSLRAMTLAATMYESLIAAGLAGMFLTQVFVNIGMTIGIMPTTGIPLPFITYGGSNTVINVAAVGLLCAIQIRGGVPAAPPLAAHDVVLNSARRLRQAPPPLARR